MVVPEERDGKLEDDPNLNRDATPANVTASTRSGGKKPTQTRKVKQRSSGTNSKLVGDVLWQFDFLTATSSSRCIAVLSTGQKFYLYNLSGNVGLCILQV